MSCTSQISLLYNELWVGEVRETAGQKAAAAAAAVGIRVAFSSLKSHTLLFDRAEFYAACLSSWLYAGHAWRHFVQFLLSEQADI